MNQQYQQVVQKLEEISHLNGVMSTLGWDQEVVMPAGAGEARARQMAALAGVIHERKELGVTKNLGSRLDIMDLTHSKILNY
jgi:Zn-dependent M32 family carboxypeptidase